MTLVLLPGLDGTGLLFGPIVDKLAAGIEPLIVRYPCDVLLGYRELLPLVEEQLPAGPFVLLGESFSGPLTVMVAGSVPGIAFSPFSRRSAVDCRDAQPR